MLTTIKWPAEALTANLINMDDQPDAKSEFVNALARQSLTQGETLNLSKVIRAGDSGIMAALLKPGMRAVTTRISVDTAAGGFIQPGDRVDIILRENFAITRDTSANQSRSAERNSLFLAQTLFENVKVLAIDQTFSTGPESGAAIPGSTATFELSQPDAELLQEAEGYGDIYLTLRGVNGAGYKGRSAARVQRDEADPEPSSPGSGMNSRSIVLPYSKSTVIELPENVMDVIVSNPSVVEAVVHTSRRTMLPRWTVSKNWLACGWEPKMAEKAKSSIS